MLIIFVKMMVLDFFVTKQSSMNNTLQDGNVVFVLKWNSDFKRGDVITLKNPDPTTHEGDYFSKRIIAVGKDKVRLENGKILVNDQPIDEPYVLPENNQKNFFGEWSVPVDHYFVLGDNRDVSLDSRHFGFIPQHDVVGKIIFRIYPFSKIGAIR